MRNRATWHASLDRSGAQSAYPAGSVDPDARPRRGGEGVLLSRRALAGAAPRLGSACHSLPERDPSRLLPLVVHNGSAVCTNFSLSFGFWANCLPCPSSRCRCPAAWWLALPGAVAKAPVPRLFPSAAAGTHRRDAHGAEYSRSGLIGAGLAYKCREPVEPFGSVRRSAWAWPGLPCTGTEAYLSV